MVNHYEKVYHNGKLVSRRRSPKKLNAERRIKSLPLARKVEKPVIVQAATTDVKAKPAKLSGTKSNDRQGCREQRGFSGRR